MSDGGRASFRIGGGGGDRRLEIVSGRGYQQYNCNPMHMTAANRSSESPSAANRWNNGGWGFDDGRLKRQKRIARYKVYSVEGKVKASIRNGLRWIRSKCSEIIHGY